jgi:hypothetical protein
LRGSLGRHREWVLPLDMVDNSLSPCERLSVRLSLHSTVQGGRYIL